MHHHASVILILEMPNCLMRNLPEEHTGTSAATFKSVALKLTHPLQGINECIIHTLRTVITGWLVM
jgi:hypothetical protein